MPSSLDPTGPLHVLLGLVVGAYGAVVGAGGGFLLTPALLLLYPQFSTVTVGTISLATVGMNSLSSSLAYARLGRIDYRTGLLLVITGLPTTIVGIAVARFIPRAAFDVGFGLLLLAAAAFLVWRRKVAPTTPTARPGWISRTIVTPSGQEWSYAYPVASAVGLGVGAGVLSGLTGIGGGFLIVPALVLLLHFPVEVAAPTSVFTIVFSAGVGTVGHVLAGDFTFAPEFVLFLGSGMILGGQLGVRLAAHLPRQVIIRMLALGMTVIGLRLVAGHLPLP